MPSCRSLLLIIGWAAQILRCFAERGKSNPLMAGAPVEGRPDKPLLAIQMQLQATLESVPLGFRLALLQA